MRRLLLGFAAAALGAVAACQDPADAPPAEPAAEAQVARAADEPPDVLPLPTGYVDSRDWLVVASDLSSLKSATPSQRKLNRLRYRVKDEAVLLTFAAEPGSARWPVDFAASEVSLFDVAAYANAPCVLRLYWRRSGDREFDASRRLEWRLSASTSTRAPRVIAGKAEWNGRVVELMLQVVPEAGPGEIAIRSLEGKGWSALSESQARTDAGSLREIRFGAEVRSATVLAGDDVFSRPASRGRRVLRGAVANPNRQPGTLKLTLRSGGEALAIENIQIAPTPWSGAGALWTPFRWEIDVEGAEASIDYELADAEGGGLILSPGMLSAKRDGRSLPRVVLVSLDTLRRDAVGVYGAPADPTPQLDEFAAESWLFERAYSPSPWTLPAHVSLLTGLAPSRHGVEGAGGGLPRTVWSIQRELRRKGYETVALTEGGYTDPRFGFSAGFDRYVLFDHHDFAKSIPIALEALADAEGPIFLFLHTYQAHDPYEPDPAYLARLLPERAQELPTRAEIGRLLDEAASNRRTLTVDELRLLRASYAAGVRHTDALFGTFIAGLAALPEAEPEVVVVTSDHGEAFQERDAMLRHGQRLYPELLEVPLMLRASGLAAKRVADPASLVDVAPTLIGLLGDASVDDVGALDGFSLVEDRASRLPVVASVQGREESFYRFGAVRSDHIEASIVGEPATKVARYEFADQALSAESQSPPAGASLDDLWKRTQRGRWEIAIRFDTPVRDLSLEILTGGELLRVLAVAPHAGRPKLETSSHASVLTSPRLDVSELRLLVEVAPVDASLQLVLPESLRALEVYCGSQVGVADPAACFSQAADAGAGDRAALASALAKSSLRIVRWAGEGVFASRDESVEPATLSDDLQAQLRALGYADDTPLEAPQGSQGSPSSALAGPTAGSRGTVEVSYRAGD